MVIYAIMAFAMWAIGLAVLSLVIRSAIDNSQTSAKLDMLTYELKMVRRDLQQLKSGQDVSEGRTPEIKHIINHKI
ncbi:hypothetical protein [Paenibacillus radicis (ex Gao et al. 2016)]|uniref:Uncharacterized protein n=1 Tax=Paenibacillus radicis (ex Gao et al. 2016) TaxID=1737354 RepID=A0A917GZY6_9BACL|nr:hypothetical protein [Paenibacillus radicis (ex Gao et al. 2016)]GGG62993.1 hypothetical protein GCM10010918_16040 [Paenibacillus radicis (ex Gao et al. 2016)]